MSQRPTYGEILSENAELKNRIKELENTVTYTDETESLHENSFYRKRFYTISENVKDVIYKMSLPEGKYDYISPQCTELFGYTPEEFYNTPLLVRRLISPDSFSYFKEHWKLLLSGNAPDFYELKIIKKTGEVRWVQQKNLIIRDNKDKPLAIEGIVTDITENKNAEEKLKKSEEKFRAYIESSPTNIFLLDETERFIYVNPSACKLLRYKERDLLRMSFNNILNPNNKEYGSINIHQLLEDGKRLNNEFEFLGKDGKLVNVLLDIQSLTKNRYILYSTDITERKVLEKAFARKSKLLVEAQHIAKMGNFTISPSYDIIEWSDDIYNFFGIKGQKLPPRYNEYLRLVHPEDRKIIRDNLHLQFITNSGLLSYEYRLKLPSGKIKYLYNTSKQIYKKNGAVDYLVVTIQDITYRKNIEKELRDQRDRAQQYLDIIEVTFLLS